MGCVNKLWLVVVFFFSVTYMEAAGEPQVPCLFIFGDSLSDSGNNNELSTDARANYLPYGIDFPGGPTGRFTNGRTAVDIISNSFPYLQNLSLLWVDHISYGLRLSTLK